MEQDDVIRLPDALPLMPRETAMSYIIRLSAYYGCRNPEQFCKDMGMSIDAVLRGEPETLSQLARVTGASNEELDRWSIRGQGSARKFINGQAVHHQRVSRRSWKFCPHCAREDIAAHPDLPPDLAFYVRAEWQCAMLDMCVPHEVKFVHYRVRRRSLNTDLLDFLSGFAADLEDIEAEPCKPTPLDKYTYARLTGAQYAPVPLLDNLPLCDAISLAHGLGAAMNDVRAPWSEVNEETRQACGADGLNAFAGGSAGLLAAMRVIRALAWADRPPAGCIGRITRYFNRIQTTSASAAAGEALAAAAFATFPFLIGDRLFGVRYDAPVLLRSHGARQHLGVTLRIWRDLLAARPSWVVYSDGNGMRTLIDIKAAEAALRPHLPLVAHSVLATEYALSNTQLARLVASGVVPPNGVPGLEHRKTICSGPTARASLDKYLSAGEPDTGPVGLAADNDNGVEGQLSVLALSKRYAIEVPVALDLIDRGRLASSQLTYSVNPHERIGVDPVEAMRIVYGVQNPMTSQEVRNLLQLHNGALDILVDAGFLFAKTRKFVNGKMRVFERAEVERFRETYVMFRELVGAGICRPGQNLTQKWRSEVVPAYRCSEFALYFRRDFRITA
ncbi:TniQ family protein [Paradevosia shaoguanensis]|uniref:TniQ family protein n=1 Tax=Paradevosia shaoguanensis TaxID=1335043 RepID=UPI0019311979|nr:TniQ family protein [Paradevosia shaoguanensis]